MEDTHTTYVINMGKGVMIYTSHDQSGSCAEGFVPNENIKQLIEDLQKMLD